MKQDPKEVASQQKLSVAEGNKIIAEFMGAKYIPDWTTPIYQTPSPTFDFEDKRPSRHASRYWIDLEYHISWDWLMPVVEKICDIGPFDINIHSWTCEFTDESKVHTKLICRSMYPDKRLPMITIIYETVISFIQWYNENKK